jgi:hypothetical protein
MIPKPSFGSILISSFNRTKPNLSCLAYIKVDLKYFWGSKPGLNTSSANDTDWRRGHIPKSNTAGEKDKSEVVN